jgi:hypothetical protein
VEKFVTKFLQSNETSHIVTGLPAAECNQVGYPVMIHAADYRRRAEDCAKRADEAQDDYHRKNFSQLATMWSEMASKAESRSSSTQSEIDDALATIQRADEIVAKSG